ncbi:MAG: hypothetical protein ACPGGK_00910 [Pikeienuella sp.]
MMIRKLLTTAVIAVSLTGCAGSGLGIYPQVILDDVKSPYYPNTVAMLGSIGGPTFVYGAPANNALPNEIIAPLHLPRWVADQSLTVGNADGDAYGGLHLALVFAPETTTLAKNVCKGNAKGGTAGPELRVLGVFCQGRKPLSEAVAIARSSPVPGDPDYAKALNQLINVLMPHRGPDEESDRPRRLP